MGTPTSRGRSITLGKRMDLAKGRPAGFDYMRIVLSLLVIAIHVPLITYGQEVDARFWASGWQTPIRMVLPMFFALSGFLVAGSFERSRTLGYFLGLRVIRIFPALIMEVILSAFILGPILTTYSLRHYASDSRFFHYFRNMLGDPYYLLPGVFARNPFPDQVNLQLWTVPFELFCYLSLAAIALLGAKRRPWLVPLAAAAMTIGYGLVRIWRNGAFQSLERPMPGPLLIICFLAGVTIHQFRHRLPAGHAAGIVVGLTALACLSIPTYPQFIAPWPIAYVTVYLGTMNPRRLLLVSGADYSYGLFLYGFPMQQTIASLGTWLPRSGWATFGLGVTGAALFAAFSWHCVERPALRLRRPLKDVEEWWLSRTHRMQSGLMAMPSVMMPDRPAANGRGPSR